MDGENDKGNENKAGITLTIIGVIIAVLYLQGGRGMNRKRQMDATHIIQQPAIDKRKGLRAVENVSTDSNQTHDDSQELSWLGRRLAELRIITMASAKPSGWNLNPSTITMYIVIIGAIFTAFAAVGGVTYYLGYRDREMQELREKTQKAEDEARRAKDLSLGGKEKGHENETEETPKNKLKEKTK